MLMHTVTHKRVRVDLIYGRCLVYYYLLAVHIIYWITLALCCTMSCLISAVAYACIMCNFMCYMYTISCLICAVWYAHIVRDIPFHVVYLHVMCYVCCVLYYVCTSCVIPCVIPCHVLHLHVMSSISACHLVYLHIMSCISAYHVLYWLRHMHMRTSFVI